MSNWRKFRLLPREEKATLLAAFLLLPLVRAGLAALRLRRLENLINRGTFAGKRAEPDQAIALARRITRLVDVAARYAGGACLARSVVLCFLLERRGVPARLRIGVRKQDGQLQAHAWVEAAGIRLNEAPDIGSRYAAFDRDFALARGNRP
jgi:hypothetical protein